MAHQPGNPAAARVTTPSGLVVGIPEGSRLVFGRGPDADLAIPAGRGLSRRAGVISAMAAGAWIANISRTHALYTEGDGYRTAAPTNNRDFAGYQTAVTAGSATSSAATFIVPTLSCITADVGIAADAGVAANNFNTASVAGVFIGCVNGKATYFPWLLVNGTEANYTSTHFSAGDVVNLSASVTTSGSTVQVTDVTKNVSVTNTITGAGASANAAWIGDDSWFSSTGTRLGVPNFGKLKYTSCLIDGTALQSWNPQQYQRLNAKGLVQIATGPFSPAPAAFATYYKHS
jgi:hypothetical protein